MSVVNCKGDLIMIISTNGLIIQITNILVLEELFLLIKKDFLNNIRFGANPFKIGLDGTQDDVLCKYEKQIPHKLYTDDFLRKELLKSTRMLV